MRKSTMPRLGRGWSKGAAAIAVGAVLALTGCGSDDDDDSGDTTEASASEDDSSSDESDDSSESDDSGDGGDSGEYCDKLESMGTDMFGASAATDPEAAAEFAATVREIADVAPGEVAEDWNTLADAMEAISSVDTTDPESVEDLTAITEDMTGAGERLSAHVMEACA